MSFEPNEETRNALRRIVRNAMAVRLRQKGGHIGYAGLLERDEEVSDWMTAFIEGAVDAAIASKT